MSSFGQGSGKKLLPHQKNLIVVFFLGSLLRLPELKKYFPNYFFISSNTLATPAS